MRRSKIYMKNTSTSIVITYELSATCISWRNDKKKSISPRRAVHNTNTRGTDFLRRGEEFCVLPSMTLSQSGRNCSAWMSA